jgi:hypothetical protein
VNARFAAPRMLIGTVVVAVGIGACALLASSESGQPGLGPGLAQFTTTPPPAPATTVGPVRPRVEYDLATVLISAVDASFRPADPARYPQGPLDAAAAARLEPDPSAERARLAAHGFQRGYQRAWTSTAGDVIGAAVYQFGDGSGAQGYLSDGASIVLGEGAEQFPLQIEGGHGFAQIDGSTAVHTVAFARGAYFSCSSRRASTPPSAGNGWFGWQPPSCSGCRRS